MQRVELRWPTNPGDRWHADVCSGLVGLPVTGIMGQGRVVAARLHAPDGATTADSLLVTVELDDTTAGGDDE